MPRQFGELGDALSDDLQHTVADDQGEGEVLADGHRREEARSWGT